MGQLVSRYGEQQSGRLSSYVSTDADETQEDTVPDSMNLDKDRTAPQSSQYKEPREETRLSFVQDEIHNSVPQDKSQRAEKLFSVNEEAEPIKNHPDAVFYKDGVPFWDTWVLERSPSVQCQRGIPIFVRDVMHCVPFREAYKPHKRNVDERVCMLGNVPLKGVAVCGRWVSYKLLSGENDRDCWILGIQDISTDEYLYIRVQGYVFDRANITVEQVGKCMIFINGCLKEYKRTGKVEVQADVLEIYDERMSLESELKWAQCVLKYRQMLLLEPFYYDYEETTELLKTLRKDSTLIKCREARFPRTARKPVSFPEMKHLAKAKVFKQRVAPYPVKWNEDPKHVPMSSELIETVSLLVLQFMCERPTGDAGCFEDVESVFMRTDPYVEQNIRRELYDRSMQHLKKQGLVTGEAYHAVEPQFRNTLLKVIVDLQRLFTIRQKVMETIRNEASDIESECDYRRFVRDSLNLLPDTHYILPENLPMDFRWTDTLAHVAWSIFQQCIVSPMTLNSKFYSIKMKHSGVLIIDWFKEEELHWVGATWYLHPPTK